jgi:hypothetical protein
MSAQYLAQHSALIANFNRITAPAPGREVAGADIPAHLFDMPIDELNLSMRTYNCLKRSGVTKVGQVLRMDRKELLGLRNFGQKSLVELYQALSGRDLIPPGTPLDVPADQIYGSDDEGLADVDVDVQGDRDDDDGIDTEPEGYMAMPGTDEGEESAAVVDALATSEGSFAMSRGIYVDDEFTGDPLAGGDELSGGADTVENRQLDKDK